MWRKKGISIFKDLYIDNTFASFNQLSLTFHLPKSHLFRYFQIRDFTRKNFVDFPSLPNETLLDCILKTNPSNKGTVSRIYVSIIGSTSSDDTTLRQQWEADLGYTLDDEDWVEVLRKIHSSSICARHGLIQLKFTHRVYWTKVRLSKIKPEIDPICDKCRQAPATLMHMFWWCPKLLPFWSSIFRLISEAFHKTIDPSPLIALFGLPPSNVCLSKAKKEALAFASVVAKKAILQTWKSPHAPSYVHWMRDLLNCLHLEKIRFTRQNNAAKFDNTWGPFMSLFSSLDSSELSPLLTP